MTEPQFATFFALLSLAAGAGALTIGVAGLLRRRVVRAAQLLAPVHDLALWLAAAVAIVCTLGSLYLSEIAGFIPCELCWFQRICMYPLSVILTIAAIRRDRSVWHYTLPLAGVGTAIAVYHAQLQAFPSQSSFCPADEPCTIRHIWEFGFVSIPFMALMGFVLILSLLWVGREESA